MLFPNDTAITDTAPATQFNRIIFLLPRSRQMLFPNDTVVIEKLSEAALRGHIFRAWDYVDEVQEGPRPDRVPHSGGREGNKPSSALPTARTYQ